MLLEHPRRADQAPHREEQPGAGTRAEPEPVRSVTQKRLRPHRVDNRADTRPVDLITTDQRFAPAPLLIVDAPPRTPEPARERALRALAAGAAPGSPVWITQGAEHARARLYPGTRGPKSGGRGRVRGAYVNLGVAQNGGLFGFLDFFLRRYPLTPIVAFSALDARTLSLLCATEDAEFLPTARLEPASVIAFDRETDRRPALIGVLWRKDRPIAVVRESSLFDDPTLHHHLERTHFAPWDTRGIAVRRFVVALADGKELTEHHLLTLDAYFDGVPQGDLSWVRDVLPATMSSQLCAIRGLLGKVDHLDRVEKEFERTTAAYHAPNIWGPAERWRRTHE